MKHTPGEWRIIAHSIIVTDEKGICKLYGEGMNFAEQIANARLIAAAPKLLGALSALLDIDPDPDPDGFFAPEYDEACERGRTAIAEATGE